MKRFLLLTALIVMAGAYIASAQLKNNKANDEIQWESLWLVDPNWGTTYPAPFDRIAGWQTPTNNAVSTGYYFVDSYSSLEDWEGRGINTDGLQNMIPNFDYIFPTFEPNTWTKIVPGPNVVDEDFWNSPDNTEGGLWYFRNPEDMDDSTDNAFAGPIPIGIVGGFYFYGIRYDSFYVTTNGLVALSNRRYFYDVNGERTVPEGEVSAYDPNSLDWFEPNRPRDTIIDPTSGEPILDQNGNVQMASGLNDFTPDDYGSFVMMRGINPADPGIPGPTDGLRSTAGNLAGIPAWNKGAVIAGLWGDGQVSQFNRYTNRVDGYGSVWFKRSITGDSLVIHYDNYLLRGPVFASGFQRGTVNADERPFDASGQPTNDALFASFQIILDGSDSSVTIHYNQMGTYYTQNGIPPTDLFRGSTTSGVRGITRHVNYGTNPQLNQNMNVEPYYAPWAGDYNNPGEFIQRTKYWGRERYAGTQLPPYEENNPQFSVKFKQWKNTISALGVEYRVRSTDTEILDPDIFLQFTEKVPSAEINNYELLAGEERIGAIQPVGYFQNLTNEVQGPNGINFTAQGLEFSARMQILNTVTGRFVYNRFVPIDDLCLSLTEDWQNCQGDPTVRVKLLDNLVLDPSGNIVATPDGPDDATQYNGLGVKGIYPYRFVSVFFPPYEPNQFIPNHIGKMLVFITGVPETREGLSFGDQWPFDDVAGFSNLWVLKRLEEGFNWDGGRDNATIDGRDFHFDLAAGVEIPNVLKMVSITCEVVSGDAPDMTRHPLPPRGRFNAINTNESFVNSPLLRMNAIQGGQRYPNGQGDQIISYPIDLRDEFGATLTLSVQRGRFPDDGFPTNWPTALQLYGPEPRVIYQGNLLTTFTGQIANSGGRVATNALGSVDQLVVEFARPSNDGLNDIVNIPAENWNIHPYPNTEQYAETEALEGVPALRILGGGGYFRGFSENDPNLPLQEATGTAYNGLRPSQFDPGMDYQFQKFFVQIPDTFIRWQNEGAKNFRFRIRVRAWNNKINPNSGVNLEDDEDDFLVDNIAIISALEEPELEVSAVSVKWPYTQIPATQAASVPLTVRVSNNSSLASSIFSVKVQVHRLQGEGEDVIVENDPVYCRSINVPNLNAGRTIDVSMPSWNARRVTKSTEERYRIFAILNTPTKDPLPFNDTTYFDFTLRIGETFAYDPVGATVETNDIPSILQRNQYRATGLGLNLESGVDGLRNNGNTGYYKRAGDPDDEFYWDGSFDNIYYGWNFENDFIGERGGSKSGRIAVRFEVLTTDTIKGFSAFFANANTAPSDILLELYEGGEAFPNDNSQNRLAIMQAKRGLTPEGDLVFGEYMTYELEEPVEISKGLYWIMITQLEQTGLELGGSSYKMGMRTTNVQFTTTTGDMGVAGQQLLLEPNFRRRQGNNELNDNYFAIQNVYEVGDWWQFTPSSGLLPYSYTDHLGTAYPHDFDPQMGTGPTISLGRGTFMPMFRPYFGERSFGQDTEFNQWCPEDIPVEIFVFEGNARKSGIELYWETASEENNREFVVERRMDGDTDADWQELASVPGVGNSTTIQRYNYVDEQVVAGNTYEYKLTQIDFDGTTSCATSEIVEVRFDYKGEIVLDNNYPNPVNNTTNFSFTLPESQNITLEIIDIYGNVIATAAEGLFGAGTHNVQWDAFTSAGAEIPNGSYIYKLTAGEVIKSGKLSIVK